MSHICGRASSQKAKVFNIFNKPSETTDKNCCSGNRCTADTKHLKQYTKTQGQHKMKRLKTRKERSQMRGGWKESSKHHQYNRWSSKDTGHFHTCCHGSCHCPSRRDALFPSVVPAAQEPSIITDNRLIGHHGLFNHEVKSIDIERLLSEQRKLEQSELKVKEKNSATSHLSSTPRIPAPFCSDGLLGADTDVVVPGKKKAHLATKGPDDCQEKEKKSLHVNSQESDITPGQRPQQQLHISPGSFKSMFSSKHSSLSVVTTKTKKANYVMSEKGIESELTPVVDRDNVKTLKKKGKRHILSTLEQSPKTQEPLFHHMQTDGISPSPQLSSSPTADSFDTQPRKKDPDYVSKSVNRVAARLCESLQFPILRKRNLVSESRDVLLKSLQEKHGPRLQEKLTEVQRGLYFGVEPAKAVQDQDQDATMADEDELLLTGTSVKMTGNKHFNWKSSPKPHQHLQQPAEGLTSPADTSGSLLDDILRPSFSHQFCMDFEPSGTLASDLFAPSPTLRREGKVSASEHHEDSFYRSKSKESNVFKIFENSFMNNSRAVREKSCGPQYRDTNIQPSFPYQAQLPDRHSTEPMHFPQEQGPFGSDRYSFTPSFPAQIHHPRQSNHLQPFTQFSHPSACPPPRPHHTDMTHYPPSHMLERSPAPSLSSFPSPEHWSFPPMRLY